MHPGIRTLCLLVHCRTGSLEMTKKKNPIDRQVHCRTGSLEKQGGVTPYRFHVHCRTGSLESNS